MADANKNPLSNSTVKSSLSLALWSRNEGIAQAAIVGFTGLASARKSIVVSLKRK